MTNEVKTEAKDYNVIHEGSITCLQSKEHQYCYIQFSCLGCSRKEISKYDKNVERGVTRLCNTIANHCILINDCTCRYLDKVIEMLNDYMKDNHMSTTAFPVFFTIEKEHANVDFIAGGLIRNGFNSINYVNDLINQYVFVLTSVSTLAKISKKYYDNYTESLEYIENTNYSINYQRASMEGDWKEVQLTSRQDSAVNVGLDIFDCKEIKNYESLSIIRGDIVQLCDGIVDKCILVKDWTKNKVKLSMELLMFFIKHNKINVGETPVFLVIDKDYENIQNTLGLLVKKGFETFNCVSDFENNHLLIMSELRAIKRIANKYFELNRDTFK